MDPAVRKSVLAVLAVNAAIVAAFSVGASAFERSAPRTIPGVDRFAEVLTVRMAAALTLVDLALLSWWWSLRQASRLLQAVGILSGLALLGAACAYTILRVALGFSY